MQRRDWLKNKTMEDYLYQIVDIVQNHVTSFHLRRAGEKSTALIVPQEVMDIMFQKINLKPVPQNFNVGDNAFSTIFGKIQISKIQKIDDKVYFIYFDNDKMRVVFDTTTHPPLFKSYYQFLSYWLEEKWVYL